jgi:DNA-directed RNA polymerase subunit beta
MAKTNLANLSLNLTVPSRRSGDRKYFTGFSEVIEMPNLIEAQLRSYRWFLEKGLKELFLEINSIKDFTGKNLELFFGDYYLDKPKYDEKTAK